MLKLPENFKSLIPQGDDKLRDLCGLCGFIHYENPKIVAGVVAVASDGAILLCRRAIEPRKGFWTLPAGFLEKGEDMATGASREANEEAGATLKNMALLGLYEVPRIAQIHAIYRADLCDDFHAAGVESLETALFSEENIPWDELAFPTGIAALKDYFADLKSGTHTIHQAILA